ncbi:Alpha beta-hydrolase [Lasiodiplodia theobromae]|uniref:Alpha beta-hydrolase n=1 Tax=Lasiodiplodia theobromae TaxID=45133 RepID=UPI0015C320FA|nr:Alpha beta-hydrolase [Lasiodiplodia theobromae]KAF4546065.1 Alpha beta-hydrolase [Lasiodiplodia theobromae]
MVRFNGVVSTLLSGSVLLGSSLAAGTSNCEGVNAISPACKSNESLHYRDFFYVGGRYVNTSSGNLTFDQIYVEKLTPAAGVKQPNPMVFFHGGGATGTTWLNTPDNRKGFASYFLDQGYQVYLLDQTSVGRATEEDLEHFPMRFGSSAEISQKGFTAPEITNAYPQSQNHTQWPGTGLRGDPYFDAFQASLMPLTTNLTAQELSMRASGCALLELIGPSYLVSHSIGALYPILLSNDCPQLVAGNINLEPTTIPFQSYTGNATSAVGQTSARPWGLSNTHIDYEPAIASADELETVSVGEDTIALRSCLMQVEPARKLPKIASVPYVALTGEASPHITYDHCIIGYLEQAGGKPEWIKLGEIGIHGNGHFGFLELNNMEIAAVVHDWIQQRTVTA